jgi:hypothetical protein
MALQKAFQFVRERPLSVAVAVVVAVLSTPLALRLLVYFAPVIGPALLFAVVCL